MTLISDDKTDNINVSNYNAEIGATLTENYINHMTKSDNQLQYILHVGKDHKGQIHGYNKIYT